MSDFNEYKCDKIRKNYEIFFSTEKDQVINEYLNHDYKKSSL